MLVVSYYILLSFLLLLSTCITAVDASDYNNYDWNRDYVTPLLIPNTVRQREDLLTELPRQQPQSQYAQQQQQQSNLRVSQADKSKFLKTGTTIIGICINNHKSIGDDCDNGDDDCENDSSSFCILAADTRATASGSLVADTRAAKLHRLSPTCYAAGAGTSADLEHITAECHATMKLRQFELMAGNHQDYNDIYYGNHDDDEDDDTITKNKKLKCDISALQICRHLSLRLYEMGGACQANLIVGGLHKNKIAVLRAIHPHGSVDELQFAALGSGGLAAMSVLESRYRPNMSLEQAIQLAIDAIQSGIQNDLGSGSQVDIVIIHANGKVDYRRGILPEETLSELAPLPQEPLTMEEEEEEEEEEPSGVNGFGNLPFRIRSRRTVLPSQKRAREIHENQWKSVLQR